MAIAVIGFVFPHTLNSMLEENLTDKIIHSYREDLDLQNFIDFAQQKVSEKFMWFQLVDFIKVKI